MRLHRPLTQLLVIALWLALGSVPLRAADPGSASGGTATEPKVSNPPGELTPEEREVRKKSGLPPFTAEELKKMTPAERQAKLREWREKSGPKLTPEERAKRREQIKDRLGRQIADLQKKKTDGTITDEERRKLVRLEELNARLRRPAGPVEGGQKAKAVTDSTPEKSKDTPAK